MFGMVVLPRCCWLVLGVVLSASAAESLRPLDVVLTSRVRGYFYTENLAGIEARTGIPATYAYGEIDRRMTDVVHPPDVAELGPPGGLAHLDRLIDLQPFLTEAGMTADEFEPTTLAPWRRGAQILALPREVPVASLLWSVARAREVGIDPATTCATWADLGLVARAHRQRTGQPFLAFPRSFATLPALLQQRQALSVGPDGLPVLEAPAVVEVLAWYLRAVYGPEPIARVIDRGEGRDQGLPAGEPLVWMMPAWDFHSYGRIANQHRIGLAQAPLPAWTPGGHRTALMFGQVLAIPRSCPDPRRAWALVRALVCDPVLNAQSMYEQRVIPAWKPAWALPEMGRSHPGFADPQPLLFQRRLAEDLPPVDPRTAGEPLYHVLMDLGMEVGARLTEDPHLDVEAAVRTALVAARPRLLPGAQP